MTPADPKAAPGHLRLVTERAAAHFENNRPLMFIGIPLLGLAASLGILALLRQIARPDR